MFFDDAVLEEGVEAVNEEEKEEKEEKEAVSEDETPAE